MIDRTAFWAKARAIFHGPNQPQVDGTNALLDAFEARYPNGDMRWLAYGLATAFWETDKTMQPVREAYYLNPPGPHQNDATGPAEAYRKKLRYYPFYGRGLVQLTWDYNYRAMSAVTGHDLVANPDDAMLPALSPTIMLYGMEHGIFGGVGFAHWFNATTDDPEGARHLVNGTDHAADIAAIHGQFLEAL